jgi:hypothetical protein
MFYRKWQIANRTRTLFDSKFNSWLNLEFKFPNQISNETLVKPNLGCSRGWPKKLFSECSEKSN